MSTHSNKLRALADAMDTLDKMVEWRKRCEFKDMAADNEVNVTWSTGSALHGYSDIRIGVSEILRTRLINDLIDEAINNQRRVVNNLCTEVFELGR